MLTSDHTNLSATIVFEDRLHEKLESECHLRQVQDGLKAAPLCSGNVGERGGNIRATNVDGNAAEHGTFAQ
jgi:hypothetical protein